MKFRTFPLAVTTLFALACERPAPAPGPTLEAAAATSLGPAAAASTASAAPATATTIAAATPSAVAILRSAAAVTPAVRIPLAPGAEVVVDPRSTFELELSARAPDARLVLVDAREDFVPSSSTRELGASTRLGLAPSAALVPGSRYALRLDGASARQLHDEAGQAYEPVTLPILAAGAPPPPEAKKPARRKRHR